MFNSYLEETLVKWSLFGKRKISTEEKANRDFWDSTLRLCNEKSRDKFTDSNNIFTLFLLEMLVEVEEFEIILVYNIFGRR